MVPWVICHPARVEACGKVGCDPPCAEACREVGKCLYVMEAVICQQWSERAARATCKAMRG